MGRPARRSPASRDEALEGAHFVIVQLRVGGQAARLSDETIPPVRLHRPGDHRRGRIREGAPHRTGRPRAGRGDGAARRSRRVVRRLHQPHRPRDASAPGRGPSGDRALQRRDLAPTAAGGTVRGRARPGHPRPRGPEPPDLGTGRLRGRGDRMADIVEDPASYPVRMTSRPSSSGCSARSRARTCTTTTSPRRYWSISAPIGAGRRR